MSFNYRTEVILYILKTPDDPGDRVELGWRFGSEAPWYQTGGAARGRWDDLNVNGNWDPPIINGETISGGHFLVSWEAKRYNTQRGDTPGFEFAGWEIDDFPGRDDQSGYVGIPRGSIRADKIWKVQQVGPGDADSPTFYLAYRCVRFAEDLDPE
jgi:hypothetical protein